MKEKIRIGVLGAASIAERSVIPALFGLDDIFEFMGVTTRSESKLNDLKSKNIPAHLDYKTFISDPTIDALYIPLPNALHFEWIKLGIEAKKHILSEKSLGCSLQEVEILTDLARKHKVALLENFQFRMHPQTIQIKKIIDSGTLGEVRSMRAFFGFPPFPDHQNIRYSKSLGGGSLLDAGAYTTKASQVFLGMGLKVKAANLITPPSKEVDVWGSAYLEHASKKLVSFVSFGFDNFYQCGIEIWGSKGKLSTNRLFTAPLNYSPNIYLESQLNGSQTIVIEESNHFVNMLRYFFRCIHDERLRVLEHELNLDQARMLEEIKIKSIL